MKHFKKSLQTIKNDIVKNEEIAKLLKKNHPHLTHLSEKELLDYFHVKRIDALDGLIRALQASQEPKNSTWTVQTGEMCSCRGSNGEMKVLYTSEKSAHAQMEQLSKDRRLQLRLYRCPSGFGWHLTKR